MKCRNAVPASSRPAPATRSCTVTAMSKSPTAQGLAGTHLRAPPRPLPADSLCNRLTAHRPKCCRWCNRPRPTHPIRVCKVRSATIPCPDEGIARIRVTHEHRAPDGRAKRRTRAATRNRLTEDSVRQTQPATLVCGDSSTQPASSRGLTGPAHGELCQCRQSEVNDRYEELSPRLSAWNASLEASPCRRGRPCSVVAATEWTQRSESLSDGALSRGRRPTISFAIVACPDRSSGNRGRLRVPCPINSDFWQ